MYDNWDRTRLMQTYRMRGERIGIAALMIGLFLAIPGLFLRESIPGLAGYLLGGATPLICAGLFVVTDPERFGRAWTALVRPVAFRPAGTEDGRVIYAPVSEIDDEMLDFK